MIKVLAEFCRFILHKNLKGETMVDGINQPKQATQHSVLKLKGKDGQTIDLNKLKGLKERIISDGIFFNFKFKISTLPETKGDNALPEIFALIETRPE